MNENENPLQQNQSWMRTIETILEKAAAEGRQQLFEYEVYEILTELRMETPTHIIARDERDVTHSTLAVFASEKIVLKIISGQIAHKQKAGGIKVVYKDLDFVKYSVRELLRGFAEQGTEVQGVLLVEHVDYSKDLGNEILLGFRESMAFGPVISFSKGGTDAEHFAGHFSAPNLILPPLDRQWADALMASTHISGKYLAEGHGDYITKIVDAEMKFSALATGFSNFFPSPSRFVLTEFEINPLIFNDNGDLIAIDGYATFSEKKFDAPDLSIRAKETLRPLFEPNGIAVVGISTSDPSKAGNIIVKNLVDLKRKDVYGVNIKGGRVTVSGKSFMLYKSVADIPETVDLAIVTVPAEASLAVVEECARKGVKAILLIPGGFSETRGNRDLEERILSVARDSGIRIMGPNCLGVVYAGDREHPGLNTFFIPEEKFKVNLEQEKNVAILSQSGAVGIMEIYNLRSAISPKVIVSYGNQLDIDPSDLVQYFEEDPMVDVIGLYIEGFNPAAGRRFFNITSKCRKPIVVYKAGRTEEGQKATRSHTASIAGEYEVAKAAMKQAGLVVADSMIDHGDFVKTFALLHEFKVAGKRVAVIANAGYEKTYAADNLGDLVLAELDRETIEKLKEIIPPYVNVEPLLDLTAMVSDEEFECCIDIMLSSPAVDALCVSIVPQAQLLHTTDQEIEHYERNIAARIVETVHKHNKPTVVSVNVVSGADAVYNRFGQVMDAGGVPTYLTAERAMTCLNAFLRYHLIKERGIIREWLR
ncbi:MAG: acetate--CoA ligase family protein [Spirochaetaceae bacterium]|nr:MAG: acetate--CoA ligase family protein [Spirochaetaceae bacterium]